MDKPWYKVPKINNNKKVVIIGGGLAGTSVAYSLAKRGQEVILVERNNSLASGASGNSAGIISPLISHKNDIIGKFFLEGFKYTLRHLKELTQMGAKVNNDLCGVFELSQSKVNKNIDELVLSNKYLEKLSSKTATSLCGHEIKKEALHVKSGGWLSPVDLCNANIDVFEDKIKVVFNFEAINLKNIENQWQVESSSGDMIATSKVVIIANANDASSFTQTNWLPLIPVRGQVTHLISEEINTKKVLCYDGGYIIPKINGINYVGATFDRDNLIVNVNSKDDDINICNMREFLPVNLLGVNGSRASLRSTSPDRRPMIGAVADRDSFLKDYADLRHGKAHHNYPDGKCHQGLFISSGFGSRGITGCSLAGEIIASMINNEPLPIDKNIIDCVNPARFIIRDIKQGKTNQVDQ